MTADPWRHSAVYALRYLRFCQLRNLSRGLLSGSWLRVALVVLCSAVFWVTLFMLFRDGFRFIDAILPATNEIVEYVFGLFFLSLFIMLTVSTGILLYTGLFQGEEVVLLLTTPAADDRVFAHVFRDSLVFSSWGFFLLGSPMLIAYGLTSKAGWAFFALLVPLLLAFALLAGAIGAVGCLLVARFAPRQSRSLLVMLLCGLVILGALYGYQLLNAPGQAFSLAWVDTLLERLSISQVPWLPSRWMARGLVSTARGESATGAFYLWILAAHAGAAYVLAAQTARWLLRSGFSRTRTAEAGRRRHGLYALDQVFHKLFGMLPRPARLLILKDLRCFRRDPAQWAQFLIFFGLLTLYFLNIRRLNAGDTAWPPFWSHVIGFMNLSVAALILSTFTTRFVYPLMSLEGRNLWILGLLPMSRRTILWGKFLFAAGLSLLATEFLIILSDVMLRLSIGVIALHALAVAVLCSGLAALSVGLGALLPDLRQDDPSRIAAGLGGTLNLVVSLLYIALIVVVLAAPAPWYLHLLDHPETLGETPFPLVPFLTLAAVTLGCLVLGALGTYLPMRAGIRAFDRLEV